MLFRRNTVPLVRGQSGGERFLRFMLLIAVFAGTAWLFWHNTASNLEAIQARGLLVDKTGTLTREQKDVFREMGTFLSGEFGQELKIAVDTERMDMPELDSKTIFIGLCPSCGQVVVEVPPLVRGRLDPVFLRELETTYFQESFASGEWPRALYDAVRSIIEQLTGIQGQESQ